MRFTYILLALLTFTFSSCSPARQPQQQQETQKPDDNEGQQKPDPKPEPSQVTVITGDAIGITQTGATLSGSYENVTTQLTEHGFYWGTSESALTNTVNLEENDAEAAVFEATLSNLEQGATYYFQAYVTVKDPETGDYVDVKGTVKSFTTLSATTPPDDEENPVVTTLTATDISVNSAVLHASFSGVSTEYAPQNVVFRYGASASSLTSEIGADEQVSGASGTFSAELTGLTSKQTVYFQAVMDVWSKNANSYRTIAGEVLSFETKQASSTTGSFPGWAELPELDYTHYTTGGNYYIDNQHPELYYTHHRATDPHGNYVRNYTVCWNSAYKCPQWVAAPRHENYETGKAPNRNYAYNPDMPRDVQYTHTDGKNGSNSPYNRGHMLGAAERKASSSMFAQVNYITNIAPQHATYFNTGGGGWNTLEDWVDDHLCSDTLYVVVGCYFDDFTDAYGNHAEPKTTTFMDTPNVQVPTMQYYILLRTKKGNSGKNVKDCSKSELKCAAFVRAHAEGTKGQEVTSKEMMSVADLEKLTGFSYFANVPNAPKDSYSPSDWGL